METADKQRGRHNRERETNMRNKVISFKDWLQHKYCDGDIEQDSAAHAIWKSVPDNGQDYRSLDLRFATIYHGRLYDIFAELWQMYEEYIDTKRDRRG